MSEYLNNEDSDLLRKHDPDTAVTLRVEGREASRKDAQSRDDFLSTSESAKSQKKGEYRARPPVLYEAEPTNAVTKEEEKGTKSADMHHTPTKVKTAKTHSERRADGEAGRRVVMKEVKKESLQREIPTMKRATKRERKRKRRKRRRKSWWGVEWDPSGSEMTRSELRWYGSNSQSGIHSVGNSASRGSKESRMQPGSAQEDLSDGSSSHGNVTHRALGESRSAFPLEMEGKNTKKMIGERSVHQYGA